MTQAQLSRLAASLLAWFADNKREMPWRRTRDPYRIWVSEVMLQQTQVATVIPYYERFLERFPTVEALARADIEDVLHCWQGLGYYSRARHLHAGARHVLAEYGGVLPAEEAALRRVPGIGEYTAGAIRSIAFGLPAAAVDGNVERVLCRLLAAEGDPKRNPLKATLRETAVSLALPGHAGDVTQALMELGATVCLPQGPRCEGCPWVDDCEALRRGEIDRYPQARLRPAVIEIRLACAAWLREGSILLERREDRRFWKTLWTLPYVEVAGDRPGALTLAKRLGDVEIGEKLAEGRCSVTHHHIRLEAYRCSGRMPAEEAFTWARLAQIEDIALPSPHRRLIEKLRAAAL